jgi:hypothetical protein
MNNTPDTAGGTAGRLASGDWFGVLDAAGNVLHNVQYPLRAMELPPYPVGGTCGIHNLTVALAAVVRAEAALRDLEQQLREWCEMNKTAYGDSPEGHDEAMVVDEAEDAMRNMPLVSPNAEISHGRSK